MRLPAVVAHGLPAVVAHADWGTAPGKRQVAVAVRQGDGRYLAGPARRVGPDGGVLQRMGVPGERPPGAVVLGFDFPIGLPRRYAELVGLVDFRSALPGFGSGEWADFYRVAASREEIGLRRPFYPATPGRRGDRARHHLYEALGLDGPALLRRCERPGAEALFWTLGGRQVGKAAIDGWREVLAPALRDGRQDVALWPFDGPLGQLVEQGALVAAETYPREFYGHLGVSFARGPGPAPRSKRRQEDRLGNAAALLAWTDKTGTVLAPALRDAIAGGFGPGGGGEDRFDSVVGLFGMLNVVLGRRDPGVPAGDEAVRRVEGWILGRSPVSDRRSPV